MGVEILDIRAHVRAMPERQSFLINDESGLRSAYVPRPEKIILLMEWPLGEAGSLKAYAAIIRHGKIHVAETFFVSKTEHERYLGSHGVFSLRYPGEEYEARYDDEIAEVLARDLSLRGVP